MDEQPGSYSWHVTAHEVGLCEKNVVAQDTRQHELDFGSADLVHLLDHPPVRLHSPQAGFAQRELQHRLAVPAQIKEEHKRILVGDDVIEDLRQFAQLELLLHPLQQGFEKAVLWKFLADHKNRRIEEILPHPSLVQHSHQRMVFSRWFLIPPTQNLSGRFARGIQVILSLIAKSGVPESSEQTRNPAPRRIAVARTILVK